MKFIITFLLLTVVLFRAGAQGLVSGKVTDAGNGTPVAYATVILTSKATLKLVDGASTDSSGAFQLKKVPYGAYKLTVTFLGYTPLTLDNIVLGKTASSLRLGQLKLAPNSQSLSGVTVNGTPPVVENKIDKMVYNAANDVTAQGGVALDVLKKVPQVSVDVDGNVELQGNSNIRFLINGKPSSIFGSSLTDALAAIPASQIQQIEVITSPGAKYDAQGTGGIINIVMKESKLKGMNGSITAAAGTRMENASVNLNMRGNKVGVNVFFSGNATLRSRSPNSQDRTGFNPADSTYSHLVQEGYTYLKRHGYEAGAGLDWNLGKNDVLSAGFQYSDFTSNRDGFTNQQDITLDVLKQPMVAAYSQRNSTAHNAIHSIDWNLDYKHTLPGKAGSLELLYAASYGTPALQSRQEQTYLGTTAPFSGTANANSGTDHQSNISLDYTKPLGTNATLEAGVKGTFQQISNNTDVEVLNAAGHYNKDPLQSYALDYNMQVYAGYVSSSFSLFRQYLDVQAGVRVEHTNVSIHYKDTHIPAYTTFVPSATFSHKLDAQNFVKLAYSRRIERPEYEELNPFLNISDPYNITTGNPLLQPEIGDNFELGYNHSLHNGGNFYVAFMERMNSHDIKPYTQFYPSFQVGDSVYSNVSVTNRLNIGREYNTGLILSGSAPLAGGLDLRGNLMVFNRHVVNQLDSVSSITNGLNWRANLNLDYKLPGHYIIEAFGNYRSAFNSIQGRAPQFISYTLAMKKQFVPSKLDIGLVANNFLRDGVRQVTTTHTATYDAYSVREVPLRSFGISVSYRFGKLEFQKGKEREMKDFPAEN